MVTVINLHQETKRKEIPADDLRTTVLRSKEQLDYDSFQVLSVAATKLPKS